MELSYTAPYYAPTPFGGGGLYLGSAIEVGSSFFFVMIGFAAIILVSGFLSDRSDADDGSLLTATKKTSVLKLQKRRNGQTRTIHVKSSKLRLRLETLAFVASLLHVVLQREVAKLLPKNQLLTETEWHEIGVQQSRGWVQYAIHRPEPHIMLFRRTLNYQQNQDNQA
ncbi:hypothetical protein L6452_40618 [Arctium lappa]|uniref:Uncharacterized protein n=1 Tax=Arctium lappa TaxID=4217 RepID=A0ACB8XLV6_ARCLA|nr:hypothetical protein L6452_40618 [Arctium lappa]